MDPKHKVEQIIIDHMNVQAADVTQNARLDDLGADSLDRVEIIMATEEEFGIHISDELAEGIDTVGDITRIVERLS